MLQAPEPKDIGRIRDIIGKRSNGDYLEAMKLTERMANAIRSADKAERRAAAALSLSKEMEGELRDLLVDMATSFESRALELRGSR